MIRGNHRDAEPRARRGVHAGALLLTLLCGVLAPPAHAETEPEVLASLSEEARAWVETSPTVRVAFDGYFPPYSFVGETGELEGLAVDFFRAMETRTGVHFEAVPFERWAELYDAAVEREVDVVATMVERPERRTYFTFTDPYIFKSLVVMARKDDTRIQTRQSLADKSIAVVRGYQYVDRLAEEFPTASLHRYDTMVEALNAVTVGKADAAVTFQGAGEFFRTRYLMTNLSFAAVYDENTSLESIGVRKDRPLLQEVMDAALDALSDTERHAIESRWIHQLKEEDSTDIRLTPNEKAWIAEHPVIRLGVDPEFRPFEFLDEHAVHRGYSADYVDLLNKRLDLNMVVVPNLTWNQVVEGARGKEVDVLPCVGLTEERTAFLGYTRGYLEFHRVIITRSDAPFIAGLEDVDGLDVVVQANSSHEGFLEERGDVPFRTVPTLESALREVAEGRADALVGNVASLTYWIRRLNLTNLKVAGAASHEVQSLHFAVRKDWPILLGILQKGLASVSRDEKQAISTRWMKVEYAPKIDRTLITRLVVVSLLIIGLVLLWNWIIRRSRRATLLAKDEADAQRQRAEEANTELRTLQSELEELVQIRTAELVESERMFHQAQKMEAMGTLVSGVAHDFNNVLSGVLGSMYLAQSYADEPERAARELAAGIEHGFRGAEMVRQLLSYSRRDRTEERKVTELSLLFGETMRVARRAVPKNIDFEVTSDVSGLRVLSSGALLEQVFMNLVNNARDAVEEVRSPKITASARAYTPDEAFRGRHPELDASKTARIDIRDNGTGIPQSVLDRIFDPFFTTKPAGKGTGLGLSMVVGAVRGHGGVVEVESQEGEGTTFSVFLPLTDANLSESDPLDDEVQPGRGELVLIADDDVGFLDPHRRMLEDLGYRVLTATDGREAVKLVEESEEPVRLAILDVMMPGLNGIAAARELRDLSPRIEIIFLTAHDLDRDLPTHLRRSNEVRLMKPCPMPLLSRTVRRALDAL